MGKFQVNVHQTGDVIRMTLSGVMDEDAKLARPDLTGIKTLYLDFDGLTGINSCGVREWIGFLESLDRNALRVVCTRCHPNLIEQVNMAASYFDRAVEIESFYVGYYCPECDSQNEVLLENEKSPPENLHAPTCTACGQSMEFDGDEDFYFRFLEGA